MILKLTGILYSLLEETHTRNTKTQSNYIINLFALFSALLYVNLQKQKEPFK